MSLLSPPEWALEGELSLEGLDAQFLLNSCPVPTTCARAHQGTLSPQTLPLDLQTPDPSHDALLAGSCRLAPLSRRRRLGRRCAGTEAAAGVFAAVVGAVCAKEQPGDRVLVWKGQVGAGPGYVDSVACITPEPWPLLVSLKMVPAVLWAQGWG